MNAEKLLSALLIGASRTCLLFSFAPHDAAKKRTAGITLLSFALLSLVQLTESWQGVLYYVQVLLTYALIASLLHLLTTWSWTAALQRAWAWYLVVGGLLQFMGHLSQTWGGEDVFRSLPAWRMMLFLGLLTAFTHVVLRLVYHLYPQQAHATAETLTLCTLSVLPYLSIRQITLWLPIEVQDVSPMIIATLALNGTLALVLSISMEQLLAAEKEKQTAMARQLEMERRQQHYVLKKSEIDAVRRQYHDMKNLLLYLEKAPTQENLHAHVGKILDSIQPFETVLETGNDAVDILLGEKLEICRKKDISCTVMVDGALLAQIDQLDLVTILGNAMDNAIEACLALPKAAQRSIQVRTAATSGFIILHIHNSCDERLTVRGSLPGTTKPDTVHHGYGLGNIRRAVKQYGGEMHCEAEHGEFKLTLLFPYAAS